MKSSLYLILHLVSIIISLFLCLPTYATLPTTGKECLELQFIDQIVLKYLVEKQIPGASMAITRNGRLIYARGFGYANSEQQEAVQPDSLFRIADISKAVSEATIYQLIHHGHIGLNDKIFPLLKSKGLQLPDNEIVASKPEITIKDLVALPYSNFAHGLFAQIIEEITRQTYKDYTQQNILEPLGITDMRISSSLNLNRASNEVTYYVSKEHLRLDLNQDSNNYSLGTLDPQCSWIASAVDLARFASAFEYPEHFCTLKGPLTANRFRSGYVQSGLMPGSSGLMMIASKFPETCWVFLFNSNSADTAQFNQQLTQALDNVTIWPEYDLFKQYLNPSRGIEFSWQENNR